MPDIRFFDEIQPSDIELVGGKGLSLGLMSTAKLPVPPGFCLTSEAYRTARGEEPNDSLKAVIVDAYTRLGKGLVAVRSSATAEDGRAASFAGQQETILGVEGDESLLSAVVRCWRSLHTERAKAYRRKQGIDESTLAMAVVVQKLVNAEVAGVLFTTDPMDPSEKRMLIEASWGLGEAVVSGRVQPDRFQVDRETGRVLDRQPGRKRIRIDARGESPVIAPDHERLCLDDEHLKQLVELGQAVERFYREPRDVEWAYADGQFFLLQARPITTASAADREKVRLREIERVRKLVPPGGTVWSRFNLVEVLPEPTPMTWSIVDGWLLSGRGGTGRMFRDFGFDPHPSLEARSVYDLIAGRPYCNLAVEPLLQTPRPRFGYPLQKYREQPHLALDPKIDTARNLAGWFDVFRYPMVLWRQIRSSAKILSGIKRFANEFALPPDTATVPRFLQKLQVGRAPERRDEPGELLNRLQLFIELTLVHFAQQSLKPTLFASTCLQILEQQLIKPLGAERTRSALNELSAGAAPEEEHDLAGGTRDLASGKLAREQFLERFGHRGNQEMELSSPRWREDPTALERLIGQSSPESPTRPDPRETWKRIAQEAKFPDLVTKMLGYRVEQLRTYLALREKAKNVLLRGYDLIRQTLLELDARFKLNGGIFFLKLDELPELANGKDFTTLIRDRRQERSLLLSLDVPPVLLDTDLDTIGRPLPTPFGATELQGVPLSAGVAEGPALVLTEPSPPAMEGYILVCPSTDPSWVPLFVQAKGLVMESGGVLSHGAIVAREFGLPAVAGLPGVHRQLKTGQRIRVDGSRGVVVVV